MSRRMMLFGGPEDGRQVTVPFPPPPELNVLGPGPDVVAIMDPDPDPVAAALPVGHYLLRRRPDGVWVYAWEGLP